jgi:hypothetical protein
LVTPFQEAVQSVVHVQASVKVSVDIQAAASGSAKTG